jgi:CheY-like chemotaxis protein
MTHPETPGPVLFIEDNESDVLLLQRAFARLRTHIPLLVLSDGQGALEYLEGSGIIHGPGKPSLILLDLKLPRKSGHDILRSLKNAPETRAIPVLVMSSSAERIDIDRAYALGADFYLVKPVEPERRQEMAGAIHAYWLAVCTDPDRVGADPTLSLLRKMAEPMSTAR